MRIFKRIIFVFLMTLLCIFSSFAATSSGDTKIKIPNDIETDFLVDYIEEDGPIYLILFLDISSDESFFMLDDIANSDIVTSLDVEFIAIDTSDVDPEAYEIFQQVYEGKNITFLNSSTDLAEEFAAKAYIGSDKLSYPFTTIIDSQFLIRYALSGYRTPDSISDYIQTIRTDVQTKKALWTSSTSDLGVTLRFKPSPDVSGISILKSDAADGQYTKIYNSSDISATAFTDTDVSAGQTWYYKLEYKKTNTDGSSVYSESDYLKVKVDLSVPQNAYLTQSSGNKVLIEWDYTETASSYFIYRSKSLTGNFELIAEVDGSTYTFTDTIDPNQQCFYKIKSFDGRNFSDAVFVREIQSHSHITQMSIA